MVRKPDPPPLVMAKLVAGTNGLNGHVEIAEKVDKRMLLMLCDNLIEALERSGFMTPAIAQARPLIQTQLKEWGFAQTTPPGLSNNGLPTPGGPS